MENSHENAPNSQINQQNNVGVGGGVVSGVNQNSSELDDLINEFKSLESTSAKKNTAEPSPVATADDDEVTENFSDIDLDEPDNTSVINEGEKYTLSQEENNQIEKYLLGADEDDQDVVEYVDEEDEEEPEDADQVAEEEVEEEVEEEAEENDDEPMIIEDDFEDDSNFDETDDDSDDEEDNIDQDEELDNFVDDDNQDENAEDYEDEASNDEEYIDEEDDNITGDDEYDEDAEDDGYNEELAQENEDEYYDDEPGETYDTDEFGEGDLADIDDAVEQGYGENDEQLDEGEQENVVNADENSVIDDTSEQENDTIEEQSYTQPIETSTQQPVQSQVQQPVQQPYVQPTEQMVQQPQVQPVVQEPTQQYVQPTEQMVQQPQVQPLVQEPTQQYVQPQQVAQPVEQMQPQQVVQPIVQEQPQMQQLVQQPYIQPSARQNDVEHKAQIEVNILQDTASKEYESVNEASGEDYPTENMQDDIDYVEPHDAITLVAGIGIKEDDQNLTNENTARNAFPILDKETQEELKEAYKDAEIKALEDRLYTRIMNTLSEMNLGSKQTKSTNEVEDLPEEEVKLDLSKFKGEVVLFEQLENIPQATWQDVVKRKGHYTYHMTCAPNGGYFIKRAKTPNPYAFVALKDEALEVAIAYAKTEKAELKIHDAKGVIEQSMSFGKEKKKI